MPSITILSCSGSKQSSDGVGSVFLERSGAFGEDHFVSIRLADQLVRCFPHVVHLACKAILKAITDVQYAENDAANFEPHGDSANTFMDAIQRDPIATLRTVVRQVCSISILSFRIYINTWSS